VARVASDGQSRVESELVFLRVKLIFECQNISNANVCATAYLRASIRLRTGMPRSKSHRRSRQEGGWAAADFLSRGLQVLAPVELGQSDRNSKSLKTKAELLNFQITESPWMA
jgi:hypothetical protein